MGKGEAAQAVEVSAYPDGYNNYEPVALTILSTLTGAGGPITQHRSNPLSYWLGSRSHRAWSSRRRAPGFHVTVRVAHPPDHRGAELPHGF